MIDDHLKIINLGSGKDYRLGCFNIDISPRWSPDLVADIGSHWFFYSGGKIARGTYDKIIAHDVLEHIIDLPTAMWNCRELWKEGGVMEILVPYDLSYGAWQDPTHVRAFNERSFIYYDEWSWYLGWKDYVLKTEKLEFIASEYGRKLLENKDCAIEMLPTVPRAVDSLKVVLRKEKINVAS